MRPHRRDPAESPCRVWRSDGGSVLLLMPAAVLIVMVLGAVAVDAAVVYLGERQASDLAASVANDAAALLDEARFYEDQQVCLVVSDVDRFAGARLLAVSDDRFTVVVEPDADGRRSRIAVEGGCGGGGDPVVVARVVAEVPLIFSRALPGRDRITVDAVTRVRLDRR